MKFVTDLSKGILGGPDHVDLWEGAIDNLSDEILIRKDAKILNLACGHMTEAKMLVERMRALGKTAQEANDSIVVLDKYSEFTNAAKMMGFKNVVKSDFMEWNTNMKFSAIAGNPPYQSKKDGDYGLWAKFIQKANSLLEEDGEMVFIVPQGWLSPTNDIREGRVSVLRDILANQNTPSLDISNSLGDYFPGVGSSFSVIHTINQEPRAETVIKSDDGEIAIDLKTIQYLPQGRTDVDSIGIFTKMASYAKTEWTRKPVGKEQDLYGKKKGQYKVINGNSDKPCWETARKPTDLDVPKVIVPYNGKNIVFKSGINAGYGNSSVMVLDTQKQVKNAIGFFNTKLIQFLLPQGPKEKYTQYNEPAYLRQLPAVDFNRSWTDQDVYDEFNITKKEIQHIENFLSTNS